jgi:uncharacterized membrane protein YcaP (DUF421 family)
MVWHDLVVVQIPLIEKVLRTVAVYLGIAILMRIGGKRDLAQLNTLDLVVMLLLANIVQNATIGPDNSVLGGLIGAAVLIAANSVLVRVSNLSETTVRVFEGTPTVLVRDGRYLDRELLKEGIRKADLAAALRRQNAPNVKQVAEATLAPSGALVVDLRAEAEIATKADVADLQARLNRLQEQLDTLLSRSAK